MMDTAAGATAVSSGMSTATEAMAAGDAVKVVAAVAAVVVAAAAVVAEGETRYSLQD